MNKYQLSKADEKCRVLGALGTHSVVIGTIMACYSSTNMLGWLLAGTGIILTGAAISDLLKR